jgi:hypothetical protein
MLKTLAKWEDGSLTDYLNIDDEIDKDLFNHLLNILPPRTLSEDLFQVGGAYGMNEYGITTYLTFSKENGKWLYKGDCLPLSTKK